MSEEAQFEPPATGPADAGGADGHPQTRELRSVQLVGFSVRDREIMRLFLRRPPGTGVRFDLVESDADLLIGNATTPDVLAVLRARGPAAPTVGIVERFERDAPFYQVAQDGQLLFSLAQAINRIRAGWTPPVQLGAADETMAADTSGAATPETVAASASSEVADEEYFESPSESTAVTAAAATGAAATQNASAANSIASSAGLPWQRALNILVIDDSHFSREAISKALEKVGFSVDTASGGAVGLSMAANKHFDVALVDFEMPEMQGPEVLRKLRALGTQAPSVMIMLTSRTGAVDRLRARFAGCDAYLTKPTQMKEFLATLRNLAVAGKLSRQ